jgi:hypothetical protein
MSSPTSLPHLARAVPLASAGWLAAHLLLVACSSDVSNVQPTGTTGNGTSSSSSSGMPPECAVDTPAAGPYPVQFRLDNGASDALFVREECDIDLRVYSCADGYDLPLTRSGICTSACNEGPDVCVACGACYSGPREVAAGEQITLDWPGHTYDFDENAAGCQCHYQYVAPAGSYRAVIAVYAASADVDQNMAPREVQVDFTLPDDDGIVTLDLSPP